MPAETIWLRVGAQDIANQEDNFVQEVRITRMVENKRLLFIAASDSHPTHTPIVDNTPLPY